MDIFLISGGVAAAAALTVFVKTVKIVQHKHAYNVLRLGKFHKTLGEGINIVIPFIDSVHSEISLQEETINTAPQTVITSDSIEVTVDGIMCIKVLNPYKAAFNIDAYMFAIEQVAQSTLRDVIGKMTLDEVFSQRAITNSKVISAVNEASAEWGVQLMRYELKRVEPPKNILIAMEKRVTAEREKTALITESEGQKQAAINISEGNKQSMILDAEGKKQSRILDAEAQKEVLVLDAEGQAESILSIANAESEALQKIGSQASTDGGMLAMRYKLALDSIQSRSAMAKAGTTIITTEGTVGVGGVMAEALSAATAMKSVEL